MENEVVIIPTVNSRAQRLLASYVPKMSASMQLAYKEGRLKFTDGYYFKRFALPASANGLQDILLNDDSQKDGYCTISKQKIDQGCAFMANRFTFKVYTVATASLPSGADEGNCTYGTVAAATAVPAATYSTFSTKSVEIYPPIGDLRIIFTVLKWFFILL